eukprot:6791120-Prorocentrum_lima.AAC.1
MAGCKKFTRNSRMGQSIQITQRLSASVSSGSAGHMDLLRMSLNAPSAFQTTTEPNWLSGRP